MKKIISTILIVILALSFPFAISANEENENDFKQNLYMGAVSYTHLDVYKRQRLLYT